MATISSLLADHVALQVRSVDRIVLAGYVPRLQCEGQLVRFLNERVGGTIPSPAILGKIGRAYVEAVDGFAEAGGVPVVCFGKSDVKEDIARKYMLEAERDGRTGVVMFGVAQEQAWAWRGWRDGGHDAHPHFAFARQAVFVNHYYFYILDPEWGPSFVKTNAYALYPVWVYLNGHEWAKRQAAREGIGYVLLENGFRACADAERLAEICDSLSELEMSDSRVFDRPQAGRAWFEQTIRDQLDLGRPDKVQIVFGKKITKTTPGRFRRRSSPKASSR